MSGLRGCLNTCVGGGIRVDQAGQARQSNDQAYFLYLFTRFEFTRFEAAVNTYSDGKGRQNYGPSKDTMTVATPLRRPMASTISGSGSRPDDE
jgi:hypothetical protein